MATVNIRPYDNILYALTFRSNRDSSFVTRGISGNTDAGSVVYFWVTSSIPDSSILQARAYPRNVLIALGSSISRILPNQLDQHIHHWQD